MEYCNLVSLDPHGMLEGNCPIGSGERDVVVGRH